MTAGSFSDLEQVVQTYFHVLQHCDLSALDEIFHPSSSLFTVGDGKASTLAIADYRKVLADREPPTKRGFPQRSRIESLQLVSADVAVAVVDAWVGEKRYKDMLSLVRDGGAWKIVAKTYAIMDVQTN